MTKPTGKGRGRSAEAMREVTRKRVKAKVQGVTLEISASQVDDPALDQYEQAVAGTKSQPEPGQAVMAVKEVGPAEPQPTIPEGQHPDGTVCTKNIRNSYLCSCEREPLPPNPHPVLKSAHEAAMPTPDVAWLAKAIRAVLPRLKLGTCQCGQPDSDEHIVEAWNAWLKTAHPIEAQRAVALLNQIGEQLDREEARQFWTAPRWRF